MTFWQAFLVAIEMLRMHKMRAFLTMLGVIIGVMSVSVIVMVSSGFQAYMARQFQQLGSDTIYIMFDPGRRERGESRGNIEGLKMSDVTWLRNNVTLIDELAPSMSIPAQKVTREDREVTNTRIWAVDDRWNRLMSTDLKAGRDITEDDVSRRANVAVIGEEISERLFPGQDPLGQFINFEAITLEVIGIAKRRDVMGGTNARDIVVPLSTAQDKWIGGDNLQMIATRPKEGVKVQAAMDAIWQALMTRSGNKPVYRVDSNESILGVFGAVFGVAGAVLAAIAALSLLVGGIGIMNIMLVSVTERTKEIGLRKSVGAKRGAILTQFLVESALLSLVGGLIGMGIAFLLGQLVSVITVATKWPGEGGLPAPFPIAAALMAAGFSAAIGVVFGLYPAISASRLDPIVALRRE